MNGVSYSLDTLRIHDMSGGLAIVSNLILSTECLVHKTLYEGCGLFVRHSTNKYMVYLAVEWLVRKTLNELSGLFVRHSMNGVACS